MCVSTGMVRSGNSFKAGLINRAQSFNFSIYTFYNTGQDLFFLIVRAKKMLQSMIVFKGFVGI